VPNQRRKTTSTPAKALNILNKQREGEAKRLERAKPKEENNFNASKALNILNKQREGEAKRLVACQTAVKEDEQLQHSQGAQKPQQQ
jgi:hypothetical protein